MFGHTSRVWRVRQLGENHLVTASEDTSVRVWSIERQVEVKMFQGMTPLAGKNVRGLAVHGSQIVSGAEDSSIRLFNAFSSNHSLSSIRITIPGQSEILTPVHI